MATSTTKYKTNYMHKLVVVPSLTQLASIPHTYINNNVPDYLSDKFAQTNSIHEHNLRNSNSVLFVLRRNSEVGKRSFSYWGAVLWNSLLLVCIVV